MDSFASASSDQVVETSQPFLGRWNKLVSQTNWEKGRIIAEWRAALAAADEASDHSDEAWSRLVGQVTPQHVGRLRRTFARFHGVYESYAGLYWSHFFAALEWNDAELWLEGAVQNRWSVAEMRTKRWETLGKPPGEQPRPGDIVTAEVDEDATPDDAEAVGRTAEIRDPADFGGESGPLHEGPDFGDESDTGGDATAEATAGEDDSPELRRPFENLAALPADLHEAFEAFKLAILHHKMKEWREVAAADVVAALRALEQLAAAPS